MQNIKQDKEKININISSREFNNLMNFERLKLFNFMGLLKQKRVYGENWSNWLEGYKFALKEIAYRINTYEIQIPKEVKIKNG